MDPQEEARCSMLSFPFWLLTPSDDKIARPEPRCPLAFSTAERMSSYLQGKKAGQWGVQLVNRYSVPEIVEQLVKKGIAHICYDPHCDGSGGKALSVAELLAACGGQ
jgi:hypothetical protein